MHGLSTCIVKHRQQENIRRGHDTLLFCGDALGTLKVRNRLKEALANPSFIYVYVESKSPSKIPPMTVPHQRIPFLAEEFPREGQLPRKESFIRSPFSAHPTYPGLPVKP